MTTMFVMDEDYSQSGVNRRLLEEFARCGIRSEREAGNRYGKPQQWVSRRLTEAAKWAVPELEMFCQALGLSYPYVVLGIRVQPQPPEAPRATISGGGQVFTFPTPKRAISTPLRDNDPVDEDALRYVAIAEGDSSLLPRLDSNQQPFGYRPATVRPARLQKVPVIKHARKEPVAA